MPNYTYRCEDGHDTYENRPMDDRNKPTKCEVCGKEAKKALTAPASHFHPTKTRKR